MSYFEYRALKKLDKPKKDIYAVRFVDLIEVIERWKLNYHLGCSLMHIYNAGKANAKKEEVDKAIWYLERYLRRGILADENIYVETEDDFTVMQVAHKWGLNDELTTALFHIVETTKGKPMYHIEQALKKLALCQHQIKSTKTLSAFSDSNVSMEKTNVYN